MAYVTPIYGGSAAQIDYRLGVGQDGGHGCGSDAQFAYRADARERPLRWIGGGLSEFGVEGLAAGAELTAAQHDMARTLMAGKHPVTGEQLVSPKLAVPADAKVPLGPLVVAVRALAAERGVDDPVDVFTTPKLRSGWNTAVRAVARRGDAALLRVDDALTLAEKAGLEAERVWPDVDLLATYSNLYRPAPVVDEHGASVLAEDGTPKTELVPRRVPVGIVGFDIGVTLPKSASLLLAFLPDELADRVEAGYTAAIEKTFAWVEGRTSYVRRGKHGGGHRARHEPTAGFAGWVMTHRAARPVGDALVGDPHWHVHITVANMAKAADGTWLTVAAGGRDLMRHAPAIDKVTQAQVRGFLHDQFGITFTRRERNGTWEVAQIPDAAIVYFSKRGQQVGAVLEQLGYSNADVTAAHARVLTRESRTGKAETTAASDATLRGLWRADAFRGGLDPDSLIDQVLATRQPAATPPDAVEPGDELAVRFGVSLDDLVTTLTDPDHGLTAHARRFSHLDAVAAVADALPHGAAIEEVERLTDRVLAHPAFVSLPTAQAAEHAVGQRLVGGPGIRSSLSGAHQMAGGQLYSTRDVTEAERTILDHATKPAGSAAAETAPDGPRHRVAVPSDVVDRAVSVVEAAQGFALSAEQRQVLERVATSSRPVQAVEGPPGTGKTTLMRAARVAWEAAGHTVAGAATAAVAAQNLAAESGISSRTVAQWLWRIDNGPGLIGVDVLVLDEANLTSDRDRAALYRAAATSGTQIVEVGDPHQLRGVGEGSMFGYLHTLLDGPRLSENRRQRHADERAALAAFREGRHAHALHTYQRIGGLVATETADEAIAAMVATWLRVRDGAPDPHTLTDGLVMLAATNEQVARINDAIQAVRAARGELGESAAYQLAGGRHATFHVGDLVLVRRNDRIEQAVTGAAVLNGYRGVVTAITPNGVEVTWRTDDADPATQLSAQATTQPAAETADGLSRAVLSPGYIAHGGLELGYALTAHKAEGLTVNGQWERPDGTRNEGTVLVYGPGMDNPGLYVSLSRDKGQAILFAARTELEGEREDLLYGPPASEQALTDRVIAALAEQANATATTANDRPVLVDLGHADPAETPGTGTSTEAPAARHEEPVPGPERTEPLSAATHHDPARQPDHQPGHRRAHEADREADREVVREPVGVRVSDEQRRQWCDLVERSVAARVADDRDAYRALLAQRRALAAELGPDRVEVLRQESHERGRRASRRMIERQTDLQERIERLKWTVQWSGRPHARLTDIELSQAIRDADRRAAAEQAAASKARRDLAGKRERLETEAVALRAVVDKATRQADELARHSAEIQQQLGGPGLWRNARQLAEQAEASYERDRHQATAADRHDLTRLERAAEVHDGKAIDAATRHTELTAEQHLRETMPDTRLALEHQLRTEATQPQPHDTSSLRQPDRALQPDLPTDLHPEPGRHHGLHDVERYQPHEVHQEIHRDLDRGPGLGL